MVTEIRYIFYRNTLIFWSFIKFQRSLQKIAANFTDVFQSKSTFFNSDVNNFVRTEGVLLIKIKVLAITPLQKMYADLQTALGTGTGTKEHLQTDRAFFEKF